MPNLLLSTKIDWNHQKDETKDDMISQDDMKLYNAFDAEVVSFKRMKQNIASIDKESDSPVKFSQKSFTDDLKLEELDVFNDIQNSENYHQDEDKVRKQTSDVYDIQILSPDLEEKDE